MCVCVCVCGYFVADKAEEMDFFFTHFPFYLSLCLCLSVFSIRLCIFSVFISFLRLSVT